MKWYVLLGAEGKPVSFWDEGAFPPVGAARNPSIPAEAIEVHAATREQLVTNPGKARFVNGAVNISD